MHVLGDYNSPVIPALIYVPAKMSAFSMECYDRGLAVRLVFLLLFFCAFFRSQFFFFRLLSWMENLESVGKPWKEKAAPARSRQLGRRS